jgi:hypothetical protein
VGQSELQAKREKGTTAVQCNVLHTPEGYEIFSCISYCSVLGDGAKQLPGLKF